MPTDTQTEQRVDDDHMRGNNIGRLCLWSPDNTDEKADDYETFSEFRRSLRLKCASDGYTGTFTWTPDASTPDTLYYQSATSYNMGWRIHVVDSIPSDITDFKEEPYQYEIWLEHQSLREVPDGVNGSLRPVVGHFSLALLLLSLFILPYRIVS